MLPEGYGDVSDLVKRLRDEFVAASRTEAADRIEQLERELVARYEQWDFDKLQTELAAEKALADELAERLERKTVWTWCDKDDAALAAYRKARGL